MKNDRTPKSNSRLTNGKSTYLSDDKQILKLLFDGKPRTMRMIEVETGVRVNVQCRGFARFKKLNLTKIIWLGVCPISKSRNVQFHIITLPGRAKVCQ